MQKTQKTSAANRLYLAGVLAITTLAYLPSLRNGLVADSWVFVYPHTLLDTLRYFYTSIIPPEWEAFWLRPIPMLFFWLDGLLWPDTTWGPHLTNLIFHCMNVWLIWTITTFFCEQSIQKSGKIEPLLPAVVACLIYGLHPLTVGSVGWVAARFDVMGVTFGLSGLLFWLRWDSGGHSPRKAVPFVSLFFIALLSKEQSVIFLAVCIVHGMFMMLKNPERRRVYLKAILLLVSVVIVYFIYRVTVFNGLGGYMQSSGELNPLIPLYFLATILFPFTNVFQGWLLTPFFFLSVLGTVLMAWILFSKPRRSYGSLHSTYVLIAMAIFLFGIATTAPHAGMLFSDIFGHAESRFTLIALTGLSLLAGSGTVLAARSFKGSRLVLLALVIWSVPALWRTDVQIQAWHHAGQTAQQIISLAVREAGNPPRNSTLFFLKIPRENKQFAYIFGIGLKEAVMRYFPNRPDITILPNAAGKDLRNFVNDRDYVFGFNDKTGKLERLYPHIRSPKNQ